MKYGPCQINKSKVMMGLKTDDVNPSLPFLQGGRQTQNVHILSVIQVALNIFFYSAIGWPPVSVLSQSEAFVPKSITKNGCMDGFFCVCFLVCF